MVVTTQEQKKRIEGKAGWLVLAGLICGVIVRNSGSGNGAFIALLLLCLAFVALGLCIAGCMLFAEARGYSKWLGLLGILSFIGLIILVLIPDRNKNLPHEMKQSESGYFRPGG